MNSLKILIILNLVLWSCGNGNNTAYQYTDPYEINEKIAFWKEQQKGTNYFNKKPTAEWFDAANEANIKFIRLTYEKWQGEQRDFLLGNADNYQGNSGK